MLPGEPLRPYYLPERLAEVDPDFLHFEEERSDEEDVALLLQLRTGQFYERGNKLPNEFNSIFLYLTGLSDEFDHEKGRSYITGGAPPDVDIDFAASERVAAFHIMKEIWGEDRFAHVGAQSKLKPRGILDKWMSVNEPQPVRRPSKKRMTKPLSFEAWLEDIHAVDPEKQLSAIEKKGLRENDYAVYVSQFNQLKHANNKAWDLYEEYQAEKQAWQDLQVELGKHIPDPESGKEPTWKEVQEYSAKLKQESKDPNFKTMEELCPDLVRDGYILEGVSDKNTIHACGFVVSNQPVVELAPLRVAKDIKYTGRDLKEHREERIVAELDKEELEDPRISLLKYDALVIKNLDIIFNTLKLIEERHGDVIDPWTLPEEEDPFLDLVDGYVSGVFQMETSAAMLKNIQRIKPNSIEEISVVTALTRPGPMKAGYDTAYAKHKENGIPPTVKPALAKLFSNTLGVLVYQEQIMKMGTELCGLTPDESLMMMRAVSKKKAKKMAEFEPRVMKGLQANGFTLEEAKTFWKDLEGYASYCFNRSHAYVYSVVTYACMWLKCYYPAEFFCALMSVRSVQDASQKWQIKAVDYIREAQEFDVPIVGPDINESGPGFTIGRKNKVHFGFAAIKGIGAKVSRLVTKLRGDAPFSSMEDLMNRGVAAGLKTSDVKFMIQAGALDGFGYDRASLLASVDDWFKWRKDKTAGAEQIMKIQEREELRAFMEPLIEERKQLRQQFKRVKYKDMPEAVKLGLPDYRRLQELESGEVEYQGKVLPLKMLPAIKPKQIAPKPEPAPYNAQKIGPKHYIDEAKAVGCYLTNEDVLAMCFPDHPTVAQGIHAKNDVVFAAYVSKTEVKKTRKGGKMYLVHLMDKDEEIEVKLYPETDMTKKDLPQVGDIVEAEVSSSVWAGKTRYTARFMRVYGEEDPVIKRRVYNKQQKRGR